MRFFARAGFAIFIFAAVAAGAWAYRELRLGKKPSRDPVSFLPAGPVMFLETSDLRELSVRIRSRSMAMDGLRVIGAVNNLCAALQTIDSMAALSPELSSQLSRKRVQLALYDGSQRGWIITFALSRLSDAKTIQEEFIRLLNGRSSGEQIHLGIPSLNGEIIVTVEDGVVLASDRPDLLLSAVSGGEPKLERDGDFNRFRGLHPPGQLLTVFIDQSRYAAGAFSRDLDLSMISPGGFSGFEVDPSTSDVRMNGFVCPDSSDMLAWIAGQDPRPTSAILTSVPAVCTSFRAIAIDSLKAFFDAGKPSDVVQQFWRRANDSSLYNLSGDFAGNTTGPLLLMDLAEGGRIASVAVGDTSKAREHLGFMSDSVFTAGNSIFRLLQPVQLFAPLSDLACGFAMMNGERIFFCDNYYSLALCGSHLASGNTLSSNRGFTTYSREHITGEFNYLAYCAPRHSGSLISSLLGVNEGSVEQAFGNFNHFSYSLVNDGILRARLQLNYSADKDERSGPTLWTSALDTACRSMPSLFRNHITGENELVVQDESQRLYLVNAKGEVLWKRALGEKVMSQFFLVDAFKNNKLQLLFNTASAIHLIDRNGNYVDGFPVKLPASATAPLAVFDYEKTRDYRLIMPCSDRQIYNFGLDGKEPATYSKPRTDAPVNLPVEYANLGDNEYLVAIDAEGKIYTFNRRGQPKGTLKNKAVAGCSGFYVDAGIQPSASYIVYADEKNGLLNKISFSDKKEILKLGRDMPEALTGFDRVDNNRFYDLVIRMKNEVVAYDFAANQLYSQTFACAPSVVKFFNRSSSSGVYAFCDDARKIVVHDRALNTVRSYVADGPPLLCDLFGTREQYLVYAFGGRLRCVSLKK